MFTSIFAIIDFYISSKIDEKIVLGRGLGESFRKLFRFS